MLREVWAEGPHRILGNGMWVTHLADPDGYHLYFESLTDAAEETVFSEHG